MTSHSGLGLLAQDWKSMMSQNQHRMSSSPRSRIFCVCLAMAYFLIFIFKELLHRRKKLNYQYMHKMTCTVLAILLSPSKCLAYACLDRLWDAIWTGWGGNMVRITKKKRNYKGLSMSLEFFFIVTGMYVCVGQCTLFCTFSPKPLLPHPSFSSCWQSRVFGRVKSLQSQ